MQNQTEPRRNRGGQPGNRNAVKHGFYARVLDETEKLEMEQAREVQGLDEEIALLRLKLRQIITMHPDRIDLQLEAVTVLTRLMRTRHHITPEQHGALKAAIKTVLRDVAVPLGVKVIESQL